MAIANIDQLASLVSTSVATYGELNKIDLRTSLIDEETAAGEAVTYTTDELIKLYALQYHCYSTNRVSILQAFLIC